MTIFGSTIIGNGLPHHYALLVGYLVTLLCWNRVAHRQTNLWPVHYPESFPHPWRELGFYAIALIAVLGIGQLYQHHWLLPKSGALAQVFEAINQILIFSPILLLPVIRKQGWASAWLPRQRLWARILVGVVLSLVATLVFACVRTGSAPWTHIIQDVYHPKNLGNLTQVLCEDIAIAILFVRMRAAIGLMRSIIVVAVLFAAAHIPAMLGGSVGLSEITGLVADAGLGIVVLYFLQKSGDIWWFWLIHFAMDMMQFYAVAGVTN